MSGCERAKGDGSTESNGARKGGRVHLSLDVVKDGNVVGVEDATGNVKVNDEVVGLTNEEVEDGVKLAKGAWIERRRSLNIYIDIDINAKGEESTTDANCTIIVVYH